MLVHPERTTRPVTLPEAHPGLFADTAGALDPALPAGTAPPDVARLDVVIPRAAGVGPGPRPPDDPLLGPAFIAAIAYVDPGNFATNIGGSAAFGYTLVWVVVLANVVAMLVQYLAAKMGVATGLDLAELCRCRLPTPARWAMWAQAELVAMATDLAEFVSAAIAVQLLFGLPPLADGGVTAVVAFLVLGLRAHGRRPFEIVITALLAVVTLALAYELVFARPDPVGVASGLVPTFAGTDSLLLASGIVGATVMPHAVYVHSAMTSGLSRSVPPRAGRHLLAAQRFDVVAALGVAGLVNVSMLVVAAALFHGGTFAVDGLEEAHAGLAVVTGGGAALAFAVALLASGLSSASVGTWAGEVVMRGLLRRRIPTSARRAITMLPAIVVLGSGVDTGTALVLSQVMLSFGIPFTRSRWSPSPRAAT